MKWVSQGTAHGDTTELTLAEHGVTVEVPGLELRLLVGAVVAVLVEGPLLDDMEVELGLEGVDLEGLLLDIQQQLDRKSTRLNSSHSGESRMPSSA